MKTHFFRIGMDAAGLFVLGNCRSLRETLRSTGAQLDKMIDKEKMAYAKLHNEVSVACP